MSTTKQIIYSIFFISLFFPLNFSQAQELSSKLKGKILLQVEDAGQAWYIEPETQERAYLGRPADAFKIMRELGLGIKHNELEKYLNSKFPKRLSGKILLDVENNGEAYYIYPEDLKGYYLNRPDDAFKIMREKGLGITNENLNKISVLQKYKEEIQNQEATQKIWQVTNTFRGSESENTEPFLLSNGSWFQIRYCYQNSDYSQFAIWMENMYDTLDTDYVVEKFVEAGEKYCGFKNIYNKNSEDIYYLQVFADSGGLGSGSWAIEIWEYLEGEAEKITQENKQNEKEVAKSWQLTQEFEGAKFSENIRTEKFSITNGEKLKIKYSYIPYDINNGHIFSFGFFSGILDNKSHDIYYESIANDIVPKGQMILNGEKTIYNKPSNIKYDFDILGNIADSGNWTIEVYEFLPSN